jgi:DNA-binding MarR family transcriptional regulator
VQVEVTAAGRELVALRRAQRAEALRRLLDQLDPDDRAAIERALPALGRLIEVRTPDSQELIP